MLARSEAESPIASMKQARLILDWTATMYPPGAMVPLAAIVGEWWAIGKAAALQVERALENSDYVVT